MTLVQLFTAIANAIRAKTGSSSTIPAENFPTEIGNISTGIDTSDATAIANDIVTGKTAYANGQKLTGTYTGIVPSGTVSITQNGTVDVTNYASANVNVSGSSTLVIPDGACLAYSRSLPANIDTSNVTNMNNFFRNCSTITSIPTLNTSNVTKMSYMFNSDTQLKTIPYMNTKKVTHMLNMCERLWCFS